MSEELSEQPLPTDGRYTTQEAAAKFGLSVRQFARVCEKEDLQPVGPYRDGQRHGVLYSSNTVDFLVTERNQRRVDLTNRRKKKQAVALVDTQTGPDVSELVRLLDRYHQESLDYAEQLGATREQLGTVTAERDAALTRVEEVSGRLGAMSAEGDAMLARLEEVVASQAALDAAMQERVEGLIVLQAERDRLKARITELEGQDPAEPVRQYPRWMFWK